MRDVVAVSVLVAGEAVACLAMAGVLSRLAARVMQISSCDELEWVSCLATDVVELRVGSDADGAGPGVDGC